MANYIAHKWSDAENAELMRLHDKGVKNSKLAIVFKTTPGNIGWRIRELKKKAKVAANFGLSLTPNPVTLVERTLVDLIDEDYSSIDTGETYDDICRVIADVSRSIEPESKTVNAKIASLCDTPDPQRELDPIDEAAISMKKAALAVSPDPVACEPTIFDRAQLAVERLHRSAEEQDIIVNSITITVNSGCIDVSASNADGESVGWHKKYQPVTGEKQ
jgi:hypothetical protein